MSSASPPPEESDQPSAAPSPERPMPPSAGPSPSSLPQAPPIEQGPSLPSAPPVRTPLPNAKPVSVTNRADRRAELERAVRAANPEQRAELVRINRMLLTQAAAAFLAMLCMMMPLPWPVLGLAAAAMAAVTGVRGIRLARRNLLGAKMATYFVWGLAMVGLISVYTVPMAATWGAQWDYQQCIERSITIEGRDGCLTDFKEQTKLDWARLNGLLGQ